jgi:hypothetical protein
MKAILIFIIINLTNPSEPAQLGHKAFDTMEECQKLGREITGYNKEIKISAFCINETDLLEVKNLS